jgi:hypothetical protein
LSSKGAAGQDSQTPTGRLEKLLRQVGIATTALVSNVMHTEVRRLESKTKPKLLIECSAGKLGEHSSEKFTQTTFKGDTL